MSERPKVGDSELDKPARSLMIHMQGGETEEQA